MNNGNTMKTEVVTNIDLFLCRNIAMPIITVYRNPSDFPGKYVARLFDLDKPTRYAVVRDTIEEVRISIPSTSLHRFDRVAKDDPNIVEVWL